jgi:hypothetical protein
VITLELFVSHRCISTLSAIALAEEGVRQVPGVNLILRSDIEPRARTLGIFIYPAFVVDGEIFAAGEPESERLIRFLRQKVEQKKSIVGM